MRDVVNQAQEGDKVLLVCAWLSTDESLATRTVGSPAEDTALLKTVSSTGDLVETTLPKYRFPGGGWLVLAPREWLNRCPGWVGTLPDRVDVMPSVMDWFSVPFSLVTPTSEESQEP